MLNELQKQLRAYDMLHPGDTLTCAVSGGADSMALLWAMYLLREKWGLRLSAAHFNHGLRGGESDADADFVRLFCDRYEIPLTVGSATVTPGKKGLEAAAREARYAFLLSLPGKIATAHTADDNAETVLMHLVRGTGLKGLGGIAPVSGRVIRPMLTVTREQVIAFLDTYHIPHVEDSSNAGDAFLRNRLRHRVMPALLAENPRFRENTSRMALRLRQDEQTLAGMSQGGSLPTVSELRQLPPALRGRILGDFLRECGVREPESSHIAAVEGLVFSQKPSAWSSFPGGVRICRRYDRLEAVGETLALEDKVLPENGSLTVKDAALTVTCRPAEKILCTRDTFTVLPVGRLILRSRRSGDEMRLQGGTKSLKKLFSDRKIPARERCAVPVISDDAGVIGVYGIGMNLDRVPQGLPAVQIHLER